MLGPLALAVLWLGPATPAGADFRSRVQVGALVLESPPELRATLERLAQQAETVLPRLERSLGVRPAGPILMVLIPPGRITDPELARLDEAAPPWAAGFALGARRIGAVRLGKADRYPFGDAGGVLVHEIVHVLLHDAGGDEIPRWFSEGVATREQRRWSVRDAMVYSSSLLVGGLPSLRQMDRAFVSSEGAARTAYAASFDFVNWAAEEYGEGVVRRVLEGVGAGQTFPEAWRSATGVALGVSEEAWRGTALTWYRWIPAVTGAGTLWLAMTLLFLLAAWRRRVKTAALMERMAEEDEARFGPPVESGKDREGNWLH